MNMLKKVLPYRVRRAMPILGLAGASLLPGACSKDNEPANPETPAAPTTPVAPVDTVDNRYDVTVNWGRTTYLRDVVPPITAASLNPDVRYIYLQCDSSDFGYGITVDRIVDVLVKPMIEAGSAAPEKIKHRGCIYRPLMNNDTPEQYLQQQQDSAFLANLGYILAKTGYTR